MKQKIFKKVIEWENRVNFFLGFFYFTALIFAVNVWSTFPHWYVKYLAYLLLIVFSIWVVTDDKKWLKRNVYYVEVK